MISNSTPASNPPPTRDPPPTSNPNLLELVKAFYKINETMCEAKVKALLAAVAASREYQKMYTSIVEKSNAVIWTLNKEKAFELLKKSGFQFNTDGIDPTRLRENSYSFHEELNKAYNSGTTAKLSGKTEFPGRTTWLRWEATNSYLTELFDGVPTDRHALLYMMKDEHVCKTLELRADSPERQAVVKFFREDTSRVATLRSSSDITELQALVTELGNHLHDKKVTQTTNSSTSTRVSSTPISKSPNPNTSKRKKRPKKGLEKATRKSPRFENTELNSKHTRSGASFNSNTPNDSNSDGDEGSVVSTYDEDEGSVVEGIGDEVEFQYNSSKKVKNKDIMMLEDAMKIEMVANRRFFNNKKIMVDQTMEENCAAMMAMSIEEPLTTLSNNKEECKKARLGFLDTLVEIMESKPPTETTPNRNTTTDPPFSNILLTLTGEKKEEEQLKQWQDAFDNLLEEAVEGGKVFHMGCMSHIDSGDEEKDIINTKFDEGECNRKQQCRTHPQNHPNLCSLRSLHFTHHSHKSDSIKIEKVYH